MPMNKSQKVLAAMMIMGGVAAAAPVTTAHASCGGCGGTKINCCCAANKCNACCAKKS